MSVVLYYELCSVLTKEAVCHFQRLFKVANVLPMYFFGSAVFQLSSEKLKSDFKMTLTLFWLYSYS